MCGSMVDIQSAADEIRRGKEKNKLQHDHKSIKALKGTQCTNPN